MIVSGTRTIVSPLEKENAIINQKSNTTMGVNGPIKQKVFGAQPTIRKALGDVTNKSSMSIGKDKKLASTLNNSNLLFVPGGGGLELKPKKITTIKPKVNVKSISTVKPTSISPINNDIVFDPMYPQPPVPIGVGAKLSNSKIKSLIMTPAMDLPPIGFDDSDDSDESDNFNFQSFCVPQIIDEPPPSPMIGFDSIIDENQDSYIPLELSSTSSFTDYYNEMIISSTL